MTERQNSAALFARAQKHIPGGVNSPVRAFRGVGGTPVFMKTASGAYLRDADGRSYVDFVNSWGPMLLGHGHPVVVEALRSRALEAMSFGAPTEGEIEMAELVAAMVPGLEKIRLVNSGTEACMSALRLARGATGRNEFVKMEGCYHGHADPFLVKAGSGVATLGIQEVPGVPAAAAADTLTVPFNDAEALRALFEARGDKIAAVILEPVAGNMGCIPPLPNYLHAVRDLCDRYGSLLIFDEVMTGFRLAPGGAQERFGIRADLVTYGKVIGGGMPIGAFAGKADILDQVAPTGKVYQAGTLSGNPLAVACGTATLRLLHTQPEIYAKINDSTTVIAAGLRGIFHDKSIPVQINREGSMISLHFAGHQIQKYSDAAAADTALFNRFFHHMLDKGIYLPPSAFETWFVSAAIGDAEIDKTLSAAESFTA